MTSSTPRIAAVLWSGSFGGAERFTAELCRMLRELGADARVLFVTHAEPLSGQLDASGIPYVALDLERGRQVVRRPRSLARLATSLGPDGVILVSPGYLAAALRLGGYRGRVIAVLHDLIQATLLSRTRRFVKHVDRLSGVWASDVEVAVSDFVLEEHRQRSRAGKKVVRIYNGVDLDAYYPVSNGSATPTIVIGWAGRIVEGKGLETLLKALPSVGRHAAVHLRIAGDGPKRAGLRELVRSLALEDTVSFEGWNTDMPAFWRDCALAAIPSNGSVESFGMVAIEAMACARPVVASRSGALPEVVQDGVTGRLVPPGDAEALATALLEFVVDAEHRKAVGTAARARCEAQFDLRKTAAAYLDLLRG